MTYARRSNRHARWALFIAGALVLGGGLPPARADAPPEAQAVLAQEHRWLNALEAGDATALGAILPDNFIHITYLGKVRYRDDELANAKGPKPYKQHLSEQTVDFSHDVAIVHGLNTISRQENVVLQLRYTDVYIKDHGHWRPISAQETAIAKQ
jgi:hypothetical protein